MGYNSTALRWRKRRTMGSNQSTFPQTKNPNQKWFGFSVAEKMGFGGVATTGAILCVGNLVRFHIFVENKKARAGR